MVIDNFVGFTSEQLRAISTCFIVHDLGKQQQTLTKQQYHPKIPDCFYQKGTKVLELVLKGLKFLRKKSKVSWRILHWNILLGYQNH